MRRASATRRAVESVFTVLERSGIRTWLTLCIIAINLGCATAYAGPALQRGVNLSHWFQYTGRQLVTRADLDAIRAAGFDHVRIPFDPVYLGWDPAVGPEMPKADRLRAGVELARAAGLDVILDLHPDEKTKQAVEDQRQREDALVLLWGSLAQRFADVSADHVAFELLNEPQYYRSSLFRWNDVQQRLVTAVRAAAPRHLILATGRKGSSPEGLAEILPLKDANIAYVFHFYLPYIFTHQGAEWMAGDRYTTAEAFRGLPYPATQVSRHPPTIASHADRRRTERDLATYQSQDWNSKHIQQLIQPVTDWAKTNHARVFCNEFGVLRQYADAASRYRWLADVHATMDNNRFGWTVWDYSDLFGITKDAGAASQLTRQIEPAALVALKLSK